MHPVTLLNGEHSFCPRCSGFRYSQYFYRLKSRPSIFISHKFCETEVLKTFVYDWEIASYLINFVSSRFLGTFNNYNFYYLKDAIIEGYITVRSSELVNYTHKLNGSVLC